MVRNLAAEFIMLSPGFVLLDPSPIKLAPERRDAGEVFGFCDLKSCHGLRLSTCVGLPHELRDLLVAMEVLLQRLGSGVGRERNILRSRRLWEFEDGWREELFVGWDGEVSGVDELV
jgi:hypothetical protein